MTVGNAACGWLSAEGTIRRERNLRIRNADTRQFIRLCAGMLAQHIARLPVRRGSGLVEQQRLFRKVRP